MTRGHAPLSYLATQEIEKKPGISSAKEASGAGSGVLPESEGAKGLCRISLP